MKNSFGFLKWVWTVVSQSIFAGVLAGFLMGVVEIFILAFWSIHMARGLLIPAIIFYCLLWSVLALGLGGGVGGIATLRKWPNLRDLLMRSQLAILLPAVIFVTVGGYMNVRFFPSYKDPRSLAFIAFFFMANMAWGIWIFHRGAVWFSSQWLKCPNFLRFSFLALIAAGIGFFSFGSLESEKANMSSSNASASLPNILLISVDALRPDHTFLGHYERDTTPHLKEFAKESVIFDNAFANSSWTRASVTTMFTSLYPTSHGNNGLGSEISDAAFTLPKALKTKGYATGVFSANAFVSPVFGYGSGVDKFYHKQISIFGQLILGHILGSIRKYSPFLKELNKFLESVEIPFWGQARKTTQAEGLNNAFLDWIASLNNQPFFAYFHYMETHTPYATPPPFNRKFVKPSYAGPEQHDYPLHEPFYPLTKAIALPEDKYENVVAQYDGNIAYVDHRLNELFEALRERHLLDKTVVIITADHGEEFYEHYGWGHGKSLYREVIHVPMIVRYPAFFPQGKVSQANVQHIDLLPTILDLTGVPAPKHLEGRSFVPLAKNPDDPGDTRPLYSEVIHENSYARTVIDKNLKLIELHVYGKEKQLLYDLTADPKEQNPLDLKTHPESVSLKQLLDSFYKRAEGKMLGSKSVEIDQETLERLKTLGYVK